MQRIHLDLSLSKVDRGLAFGAGVPLDTTRLLETPGVMVEAKEIRYKDGVRWWCLKLQRWLECGRARQR